MEPTRTPRRKGRATSYNPATRFDPVVRVEDPDSLEEKELRQIETTYHFDSTRSALAENRSPDIPFTYSLNPYRGCEHGCIYCYARPSHEYLGFSAGLDFETRILVKENIHRLLEHTLGKSGWKPQTIALSGNTDPYQPAERNFKLTRSCLEVLERFRNPVGIITKNHLVTRDLDILQSLAARNLVRVMITITSLDADLIGEMEPRTSRPERRLEAIERLAAAGIPVGVMVAPVIPGLTDDEMAPILKAAYERGARTAGYVMLRLPGAVKELFIHWVSSTFPDRKDKIINRLKSLRGDDLTDNRFGNRMRGQGEWAHIQKQVFKVTCEKLGMNKSREPLATHHFRRVRPGQGELFD